TPIPGATVTIPGAPLPATTDAEGRFAIADVPVGPIHLHIDPSTSPRLELFPPLAFEVVTVAGRANTLGMPIHIPALNAMNARMVGGDEDVVLTMEGVPGLEVIVAASSATFPDGSRAGLLSIDQVHLDKVPMPPPLGTIFMPPTWTLQPAGVHLDPPARILIPNNGLAPGRVIELFQFDHDLFRFINVGQATVTEDGLRVVTDEGFGITRTGWGGLGPPTPPTTCASSCDDGNPCTRDYCQTGFCFHIFDVQVDAGAAGDCKKIFCENGELMEVNDDTDAPRQASSTDCVRQICQNGTPTTEPDDAETPPQSSPNDCFREICSGGSVTLEPDDSEEPSLAEDADEFDCMRLVCEFGSKVLRPAPDKESPMQTSETDCMAQLFDPDCDVVDVPNDNEFPPDGPGPDGDCRL
ncbi:MAG: hypothetical protein KDA28_12990, partial [Phycisphaerales bacterium]|nr:hypothetical protein [Phycisphaerales bacterium]